MSEENVEIVRRGYEAYNRGDPEGMTADLAPNFEYETTGSIPGVRARYEGPEGWIEGVGWLASEFENPRVEIRELIDAGDQVLALITIQGRGKQSGVETSWDLWQLWTMRDGKVVHGRGFMRRDEALDAAGLSE
jgi:ketosteroid isomerase-like protein